MKKIITELVRDMKVLRSISYEVARVVPVGEDDVYLADLMARLVERTAIVSDEVLAIDVLADDGYCGAVKYVEPDDEVKKVFENYKARRYGSRRNFTSDKSKYALPSIPLEELF